MTRKRRMFQIDIPEEAVAPPAPSGPSTVSGGFPESRKSQVRCSAPASSGSVRR
mgnify:CR=1 FL=1